LAEENGNTIRKLDLKQRMHLIEGNGGWCKKNSIIRPATYVNGEKPGFKTLEEELTGDLLIRFRYSFICQGTSTRRQ